jgi:alpha-galactosidase
MPKIVIIGAGSRNFAKNIITDVVLYPELRDSTIALVDIDQARLDLTADFARTIVKQYGFNTKIESTMNRQEALKGANYVIVTIAVGGPRLNGQKITEKYGLPWDDTVGPCGVLEANREIPLILNIAHDMEKICPDAWLLNYSNPMAMICWAINDYSHIKSVGCCPNQRNQAFHYSTWLDIPFEEVYYWSAGINHFSFYLELKWRGKDMYQMLKDKFGGPGVYSGPNVGVRHDDDKNYLVGVDLVEVEMLKRFGYMTTGSGGHIPEYVPYFVRTPELYKRFRLGDFVDLAKHMGARRMAEEARYIEQLASGYKFPLTNDYRWTIWAVNVIHSLETGTVRKINVSVKNTGLITNLTKGCVVEVPCMVDKGGVHPCYVGDLPPQCAALIQANVNVQQIAVKGIVEKDKNQLLQAVLVDPLTRTMLSIDEMNKMMGELFDWEKEYVKGYKQLS